MPDHTPLDSHPWVNDFGLRYPWGSSNVIYDGLAWWPRERYEQDQDKYPDRGIYIPGREYVATVADPEKCPMRDERRWPCHFTKGHTTPHAFTDAEEMQILRQELATVNERVEKILALHQPEEVFDPEAQETITICGACHEITGGDICTTTQILRGEA